MWKDGRPGGGKGSYYTENGEKIEGLWEDGKVIPSDTHQPEFTNKQGETSVWSELEENTRNLILNLCIY